MVIEDKDMERVVSVVSGEVLDAWSGFVDALSGEVDFRFKAARDARKSGGIEKEMVSDLRRRDGEYEPEVMAALEKQGGSKAFDNITDVKCSGGESMLSDLFFYNGHRPMGLEATPLPELGEDAMEVAVGRAMEWAAENGVDPMAAENEGPLMEYALTLKEQMRLAVEREAKKRAKGMEDLIWDQLREGGFEEALNDFIVDFCTHKVAGLMGPVPTVKTMQVDGEWVEKIVLAVERVNPTDIYPAAGSLKPEDGDFFVRRVVSDDKARELYGCPGVDEKRLTEALARGGGEKEDIDTELEYYSNRGGSLSGAKKDPEHVLVYWWHRVGEKEIAEWKGLAWDEEKPSKKVAMMGLMLNGIVVKAVENLDRSGKPNVFVASFRKRPGSFWGYGLAGLCKETQEAANVIKRALMNNIHMSSMVSYQADKAALVHPDGMAKQFPGQVVLTRQMPGDNRDPIKPLVTPNYTDTLLNARNNIVTSLDEKTGVYPQSYGNPNQVGPAETLGGYQLLRQDQTKTLKRALKNMSDAIAGLIRAYWQWNMVFSDDESIKGDVEVVTRGAVQLYMTADEAEQTMAAIQMLERSPMAAQFLKPGGLAALYRHSFRMHKIDPEAVFKSDKEIEEEVQMALAQRQAEMSAQAAGGGGEQAPQMMPDKESSLMKAQADMVKAQTAQEKVQLERQRVNIQQAEAIGRLRKMQEEIRKSRMMPVARTASAMPEVEAE